MTTDLLDRELYTVADAGRLLQVAPSTLRWWLEGRTVRKKPYPPVIRERRTGSGLLTWGEFIEAGYLSEYRRRDVPLRELRAFIDQLRQDFGIEYPLATLEPFVSHNHRLVLDAQRAAQLSPEFSVVLEVTTGQTLLSHPAETFLERVEFTSEEGRRAIKYLPAGKHSPVALEPGRAFGAPNVSGIRTEALTELVDAGEDLAEVARDFGLTPDVVKAAVAFEWSLAA